MHRIFRWLFLFCLFPRIAVSQADSLQEVKGLPTKQIFDLMIDSSGFLWIGHDLGLSRYDGTSFTRFSSPQQNSLAVGDLLEDKKGRIWCRNFSSQIFFVENEQLTLLSGYEAAKEPRFPRMVLIGDQLVASSAKGLFICNTSTLETFYVPCGGASITTLAVVGNKIIAYGDQKWFLYDPSSKALPRQLQFDYPFRVAQDIVLQPSSYNDTLYSFSSRTGDITKLIVQQNAVNIIGKIKSQGFMNTVNPSGNNTWIHTKEQSETIGGNERITGYDLSDLVIDKQGNAWYSSFKYGLLIKYRNQWEKIKMSGVGENEIVERMERGTKANVYGTNKGNLIQENASTGKISRVFALPADAGPLQYIKEMDSSRFIISTALRIFMLQVDLQKLENVSTEVSIISLKNAVLADSSIFVAAATGLYELFWTKDKNENNIYRFQMISNVRSRWVDYDKTTKTLLVAFKDGLAEVRNNKIIPILYNKSPVPAITIQLVGNTFYISTYGNDLMTYDASGIKKVNILDQYIFYPVNQIKARKDTIWLLGTDYIVLFNPVTGDVYRNIIIPAFPNANIYEISWIRGEAVLLTSKGTYRLKSSKPDSGFVLKNYLLKVGVNGMDISLNTSLSLPSNQNSLDFYLGVPFYTNAENIYFKYRLSGSSDETWKISENGENEFRFLSLGPGDYVFEAVAVHPQFGSAKEPIVFPFTIRKAWYQTTLYRVLLILFIVGSILLLVIHFYKERLRIQKMDYEKKLAIFNERQRISAEIHDDIGAGLSGVRLLTELTGNKITNAGAKDDLDKIYSSITELSAKMKEVVWSLNTTNDSLENLLLYIQLQTMQMMENGPAKLSVSLPELIPPLQLGSDKRTDIYLSVKEAVHNALKHSAADRIELRFLLADNKLNITVRDNGKGLPVVEKTGNGILNMRKRIARLKGTMAIKNQEGLTVEFSIPLT